jgi:hypothetical protein
MADRTLWLEFRAMGKTRKEHLGCSFLSNSTPVENNPQTSAN